jgi:hypothetical protein
MSRWGTEIRRVFTLRLVHLSTLYGFILNAP